MRNSRTIINTLLSAVFICGIAFAISSCNNGAKTDQDTKATADEHNDAKYDSSNNKDDAAFLVEAAAINMKEIKLGQLAQQQGSLQEVKDLGKMMEDAHTKAQSDLVALAAKKQITLPDSITAKGTEAYNKLNEKKGNDFDKRYCDMMVKGHKKAIEKFEKAAADSKDADIKAWATGMLPDLRNHLDHAITTQKLAEK